MMLTEYMGLTKKSAIFHLGITDITLPECMILAEIFATTIFPAKLMPLCTLFRNTAQARFKGTRGYNGPLYSTSRLSAVSNRLVC